MSDQILTQHEIRNALNYCHVSGVFSWRKHHNVLGKIAGHKRKDGYIVIRINNVLYLAHRLVWLYVHGEFPSKIIDHINGNPTDNRICNLRSVTHKINLENQRKPKSKNNMFLGVTFEKRRKHWVAQIYANNKHIHIGSFSNQHDAHKAYVEAKRKLHEGCTI